MTTLGVTLAWLRDEQEELSGTDAGAGQPGFTTVAHDLRRDSAVGAGIRAEGGVRGSGVRGAGGLVTGIRAATGLAMSTA